VYIDGNGGSTAHTCRNGQSTVDYWLSNEKLVIGGREANDNAHNPGNIDISHVLVYDRALTQNEISSIKIIGSTA